MKIRGRPIGSPQKVMIGEIEAWAIREGGFSLDGGTMFGMVPKVLWSSLQPADERNRIHVGTSPLLLKTKAGNFVVDPGVGNCIGRKREEIYGIEHPRGLLQGLEEAGCTPDGIKGVIFSHLHFDHAAGVATRTGDGSLEPTFPQARYYVQEQENADAWEPNELSRGSYFPDYLEIVRSGDVEFCRESTEVAPGIRVEKVGGHTRALQIIIVESRGEKAVFWSDLVPTSDHLRIPYVAGIDLYPLEVVEAKKTYLARACEEKWVCFFYHNIGRLWGTIEREKKNYSFRSGVK